jgi:hypothetical protein
MIIALFAGHVQLSGNFRRVFALRQPSMLCPDEYNCHVCPVNHFSHP